MIKKKNNSVNPLYKVKAILTKLSRDNHTKNQINCGLEKPADYM